MSNRKLVENGVHLTRDEVCVDLWYPDVEGNEIKNVRIGLVDVRATDDIRLHFDKHRDGWVVEQASIFEWDGDDKVCDPDWQEVAFIKAWARKKQ